MSQQTGGCRRIEVTWPNISELLPEEELRQNMRKQGGEGAMQEREQQEEGEAEELQQPRAAFSRHNRRRRQTKLLHKYIYKNKNICIPRA